MLLQFWKEPFAKVVGDTVTVVLSKFFTFTVVRVISSTIPFAGVEGTTIQSPLLIILLLFSFIPATKPSIVSLKTNIRIAEVAPNPAISDKGFLLKRIAIMMIVVINKTTIRNTPRNDLAYCRIEESVCGSNSSKFLSSTRTILDAITAIYTAVKRRTMFSIKGYW